MANFCSNCGSPTQESKKFCANCGIALQPQAQPQRDIQAQQAQPQARQAQPLAQQAQPQAPQQRDIQAPPQAQQAQPLAQQAQTLRDPLPQPQAQPQAPQQPQPLQPFQQTQMIEASHDRYPPQTPPPAPHTQTSRDRYQAPQDRYQAPRAADNTGDNSNVDSGGKKKSVLPFVLCLAGVLIIGLISLSIFLFLSNKTDNKDTDNEDSGWTRNAPSDKSDADSEVTNSFKPEASDPETQTLAMDDESSTVTRNTAASTTTTAAPVPPTTTMPTPLASAPPIPSNNSSGFDLAAAAAALSNALPNITDAAATALNPAEIYASTITDLSEYTGAYAFYDIDGNGVAELIISYSTGNEDYTKIYTFVDGKVYDIGEFWSRNRLELIDSGGTIFNVGSDGAASSIVVAYRISDDKKSLSIVDRCDADYDAGVFTYTKDNKEQRISEEDFNSVTTAIYSTPSILNNLIWLPIPSGTASPSGLKTAAPMDGWTNVKGRVRIPPTWTYEIEVGTGPMEWINISGEGVSGSFAMAVGYINASSLEQTFEESISYHDFMFSDGSAGYMVEYPDFIMWVLADSWWNGIILYHEGNRSIYTENEAIISTVAASASFSDSTAASSSSAASDSTSGKTDFEKLAYVMVNDDALITISDADQLVVLIDEVVWIYWNDYDLQREYGITEMDDDYSIVNKFDYWQQYTTSANAVFILVDYYNFETGAKEVGREEFASYALDSQRNGSPVLARVLITGTGEVAKIEEVFRP